MMQPLLRLAFSLLGSPFVLFSFDNINHGFGRSRRDTQCNSTQVTVGSHSVDVIFFLLQVPCITGELEYLTSSLVAVAVSLEQPQSQRE